MFVNTDSEPPEFTLEVSVIYPVFPTLATGSGLHVISKLSKSKAEARNIFKDIEVVFHLAADHGGRGYITTHPADVCSSFAVDHHVFEACSDTNVEKVIFSSSACVYPTDLQKDIGYLLKRLGLAQ